MFSIHIKCNYVQFNEHATLTARRSPKPGRLLPAVAAHNLPHPGPCQHAIRISPTVIYECHGKNATEIGLKNNLLI